MEKTKGFTLAEVLVGLSIVGIAAALTIPQLVKSIQKVETGPKLSRAVQQFEVSSQDYFDYRTKKDEKASHYTKFSDMSEVSLAELATFWGLTPIINGPTFNIDNYAEYAHLKQPLLLQSAYAATPGSMDSVEDKTSIGDLGNPWGDTSNFVGDTGKVELKRNCYNVLTGEGCEEGSVGCKCSSDDNNDDEDKVTLDPTLCVLGQTYVEGIGCTKLNVAPLPDNEEQEEEQEEKQEEVQEEVQEGVQVEDNNPSSSAQAYHSKKGGYDVFFEDDKIDTTGKTKNEDIVVSFYLDTNGTKNKPNMKGKDLFKFHLRNDGKIEPEGLKNRDYEKNCADSGVKDGLACTARIVRDGYKIKY